MNQFLGKLNKLSACYSMIFQKNGESGELVQSLVEPVREHVLDVQRNLRQERAVRRDVRQHRPKCAAQRLAVHLLTALKVSEF